MIGGGAAAEQFRELGYCLIPGAIDRASAGLLRDEVSRAHQEPCPTGHPTPFHRHQMFLRGPAFERMLDVGPVIDVVEDLLGDDCHVIANNTVYTQPHSGIDRWHVDETVLFPLPPGTALPPAVQMPVWIATAMFYLDDVDHELGPTEIVPRSHRSGRRPPEDGPLEWEGEGAVAFPVSVGDCLLLNGQTWHRGATNRTADRVRHVLQVTYGRRFIAQRFYPFVSDRVPAAVLKRSSVRRRRLLGEHAHGPYG